MTDDQTGQKCMEINQLFGTFLVKASNDLDVYLVLPLKLKPWLAHLFLVALLSGCYTRV